MSSCSPDTCSHCCCFCYCFECLSNQQCHPYSLDSITTFTGPLDSMSLGMSPSVSTTFSPYSASYYSTTGYSVPINSSLPLNTISSSNTFTSFISSTTCTSTTPSTNTASFSVIHRKPTWCTYRNTASNKTSLLPPTTKVIGSVSARSFDTGLLLFCPPSTSRLSFRTGSRSHDVEPTKTSASVATATASLQTQLSMQVPHSSFVSVSSSFSPSSSLSSSSVASCPLVSAFTPIATTRTIVAESTSTDLFSQQWHDQDPITVRDKVCDNDNCNEPFIDSPSKIRLKASKAPTTDLLRLNLHNLEDPVSSQALTATTQSKELSATPTSSVFASRAYCFFGLALSCHRLNYLNLNSFYFNSHT
ncbi:unnamed protein product [Protopolystoma xenopodis]|uniref:Uncharacterized protein n=1 Tax=Protopolystoma xenopodis TaxID=117903 RepID=A0A3S5AB28_9PLAT|nr:unnamed protein product [Protopolystoma xenopodis]